MFDKLTAWCVTAALLAAAAGPASATSESRATVIFLLIKPDARAIAMGEAYVAVDDNASYFNPAALAGQTERKLHLTHAKWLPGLADDMSYEFVAYSQPVEGWGNVGFNGVWMNLGEQTRMGERPDDVLGTFSSNEFAISVAYGAEVSENMKAGVGLKFIHSRLSPEQGAGIERGKGVGSSFAADLGMLWGITPALTFGSALRYLGPKMAYIDPSQADPLPQHIVAGVAYELLDTEYHDILFAFDLYKPLIADGSFAGNLVKAWADESMANEFKEMDFHVGGEYRYGLSAQQDQSFLALRAGYRWDHDGELKFPTFGMGLKYNMFQVDVAYVTGDDTPMEDNTRFSLNLTF